MFGICATQKGRRREFNRGSRHRPGLEKWIQTWSLLHLQRRYKYKYEYRYKYKYEYKYRYKDKYKYEYRYKQIQI